MYDVIGHTTLRAALAAHSGSFALLGPQGVGRRGVVAEWLGDRPAESLTVTQQGILQAVTRPQVTYLIDGDARVDWPLLLRPLEENTFPVVVVAERLSIPVYSRLPIFTAGLLSDAEIVEILSNSFPKLHPRPVLARVLGGSLTNLGLQFAALQTFETLETCLAHGTHPVWKQVDPVALLMCFRLACATVLGASTLPFTTSTRRAIPRALAVKVLFTPLCYSSHEARNYLQIYLPRRYG